MDPGRHYCAGRIGRELGAACGRRRSLLRQRANPVGVWGPGLIAASAVCRCGGRAETGRMRKTSRPQTANRKRAETVKPHVNRWTATANSQAKEIAGRTGNRGVDSLTWHGAQQLQSVQCPGLVVQQKQTCQRVRRVLATGTAPGNHKWTTTDEMRRNHVKGSDANALSWLAPSSPCAQQGSGAGGTSCHSMILLR